MLNHKSEVITDALDGKAKDLQISRTSKQKCIEEVNDRKEKGQLNPVIVNRKKEGTLDQFLTKNKDFVKRSKTPKPKKSNKIQTEEIEDDSEYAPSKPSSQKASQTLKQKDSQKEDSSSKLDDQELTEFINDLVSDPYVPPQEDPPVESKKRQISVASKREGKKRKIID